MVGKYLDPDPPPIRKGGSGEYSTSSHHGLDVAMDSQEGKPLKSLAGVCTLEGVLCLALLPAAFGEQGLVYPFSCQHVFLPLL